MRPFVFCLSILCISQVRAEMFETVSVKKQSQQTVDFTTVEGLADKWSAEAANVRAGTWTSGQVTERDRGVAAALDHCASELLETIHPKITKDLVVYQNQNFSTAPVKPVVKLDKYPVEPNISPYQVPVQAPMACSPSTNFNYGWYGERGSGIFGGNGIFANGRQRRAERRGSRGGLFGLFRGGC